MLFFMPSAKEPAVSGLEGWLLRLKTYKRICEVRGAFSFTAEPFTGLLILAVFSRPPRFSLHSSGPERIGLFLSTSAMGLFRVLSFSFEIISTWTCGSQALVCVRITWGIWSTCREPTLPWATFAFHVILIHTGVWELLITLSFPPFQTPADFLETL